MFCDLYLYLLSLSFKTSFKLNSVYALLIDYANTTFNKSLGIAT